MKERDKEEPSKSPPAGHATTEAACVGGEG